MISEDIKKTIEGNALALATLDEKGNPHVIAVADVKVIDDNNLLIGAIFLVETIKNIEKNNNVSLAVWNKNWEEDCMGYELKGTAEYFTEGHWKEKVKEIHKGFSPKGAIIVTVSKIKGLA